MKKLFRPYLTFLLLGSLLVATTSCKDDDPTPGVELEDIASARLVFEPTPDSKGNPVTINYSANSQQPTAAFLSAKTYVGTLTLYNEAGDDVTSEISQDANMHEVFYEPSAGSGITVQKTDTDGNNRPLGLKTTLTTTNAGSGTMRVRLKHQPDKNSTSDVNKGETDLDMTVNVIVQ